MTDFREPTSYERAIIQGLQRRQHIYGGTMPRDEIARRRAANRRARAARRITRAARR